jgi:fido (protein-threonine AMPylation protein)
MYTPTLDVTHKMVHHIVEIEHAISDIKDTPLTATAKEDLLERMGGENLHNIGKLLACEAPFKEAEKIAKGRALISQGSPEMILANFRSTTDFIYSSSNDRYISLSPALLIHLNKLLTNNVFDSWDCGKFRNISDEVKTDYDQWFIGKKRELKDLDLQQHFYEVLNWFSENRFYIHPLIKIGCVIYELFHIYPFVAGNQITILATAELLFEKSKLSLGGLLPIARNFVLYEDEYLEALQVSAERNDDQTLWIEKFIRGISLDIASLKNEVIRIEEEKIKKKKKKLLDLNSRQLKLIRHLKHNKKIKRKEYVKMMGVSTMTAYRDINELVDRKILEVKGGGRSTHYVLKKENDQEGTPQQDNVIKVISDEQYNQTTVNNTDQINSDNFDVDNGSVSQVEDFSGFVNSN